MFQYKLFLSGILKQILFMVSIIISVQKLGIFHIR